MATLILKYPLELKSLIFFFWNIMFLLFLSLISFSSWSSSTKFDLSAGLQGRTLPSMGAELYAESGYNMLLWGSKKNSQDVLYGLLRPSLGLSTSGVINVAKAELELFPISFLGFTAGRQYIHSNFDFPFFDCEAVSCKGEFERNYIESKMILGVGGWIAMGSYKIDKINSPDENIPMPDWRNVIVGNPSREIQIEKKLIAGKIHSGNLFGIILENVQFLGSRERKESFMGVYQKIKKSDSYMIGAGLFHTDRQPMGFQVYFRIHKVFLPYFKLF